MADLNLSYEWEGLDDVNEALQQVQDAVEPPNLTASLAEGADVFVEAGRFAAPKRSGRLSESIDKTEDGPTAWTISPDTEIPYAFIQEFGGDIYPVNAKALRFVIDGHVIFAQHVYVPGTHYMESAFTAGVAVAAQIVDEAIRRDIG